ncbi:MAG: UDP-N-acetylmuramoyl-tripeptide--D-alanyl-D-alanine ligase [Porticoccaceae bacterium]
MMQPISFATLAHKYGGVLIEPDVRLQSLCTDSRTIKPGQVFLALKGGNFDGHEYLDNAVNQGASALVTEKVLPKKAPQWIVKNSLRALGYIAVENREAFTGKLVALTGSNGKTSVKEMISMIMRLNARIHATQGNLNNHIGVPLTLLGLNPEHQYGVIEMGASGLGEINYLTGMTRPDVALVNNVGDAHVGEFGSVKNIEIAKGEIFNGLSSKGTGVVNLDSVGAGRYLEKLIGRNVLTFSLQDQLADISARSIRLEQIQASFELVTPAGAAHVKMQVSGRHNVANALAAAACCTALNIPLKQIVEGLQRFEGVSGRLARHQLPGGAVVIDDSYNASPSSVRAAIDLLALASGQRILVLGNMAELGNESASLHAQIGRYARDRGIDHLLTVGVDAAQAAKAFGSKGQSFDSKEDLVGQLVPRLDATTSVLVKGSRSSRMEDVVNAINERGV